MVDWQKKGLPGEGFPFSLGIGHVSGDGGGLLSGDFGHSIVDRGLCNYDRDLRYLFYDEDFVSTSSVVGTLSNHSGYRRGNGADTAPARRVRVTFRAGRQVDHTRRIYIALLCIRIPSRYTCGTTEANDVRGLQSKARSGNCLRQRADSKGGHGVALRASAA